MKTTPLYDEHVEAGARIVPFAGFLMPLQYKGIIEEHRAVRENVGIFDLSHMGEFRISGRDALSTVDALMSNDIGGLEVGQVRYTPMCYETGGIVDDLLVYRYADHLMLVVNAANIDRDLEWVCEHVHGEVEVRDASGEVALIAVQGPAAQRSLQGLTGVDLIAIEPYHFTTGEVAGVEATISRTGYTGEDGFELYVAPAAAQHLWRALLRVGSPWGLQQVGLGARDTLRLEAGYMLYGNDITADTTPIEAGLGWTVKLDRSNFVGREILERQKADGVQRKMVALGMLDRAIPRPHSGIWLGDERVGDVTSGTFSPTFHHGVGLGYVATPSSKLGTDIDVEIRGVRHPARIVRKPIYKRGEK